MNLPANIPFGLIILELIIAIWTFTWKALSLWRSARNDQTIWFIVLFLLLPINSFGIIEIIYLFFYAKKKMTIDGVKKFFIKVFSRRLKPKSK